MDPLLLVIPLVVIFGVSWYADHMVRRYDGDLPPEVMPKSGRLAETILARHWINDVRVHGGDGDYYAPIQRRIELSDERIARGSTSAAAIAAHEAAHAVQHALRIFSARARLALALPDALASLAWFPIAIAAALLDSELLATVAFGLFTFTLAVSVLTAFNEVDASRRALRELHELLGPEHDQRGARRVLVACGATYVSDTLLDFHYLGRRLRRDEEDGGGGQSSTHDSPGFIRSLFD